MQINEIMTKNPEFVYKTDSIKTALTKMLDMDIRHLPVVSDDKVVGIISDRDIRDYSSPADSDYYQIKDSHASLEQSVGSIMAGVVIAITENSEMSELLDVMLEGKLSAIPVIDNEDKLVGIVSYIDILKYFRENLAE